MKGKSIILSFFLKVEIVFDHGNVLKLSHSYVESVANDSRCIEFFFFLYFGLGRIAESSFILIFFNELFII